MKRDDILPLLRSKRSYRHLRNILRHVDEAELFYGLYPVAVKEPYKEWPITIAAKLLLGLNPKCQIPCVEAIRMMLAEWFVSLEEVPFYLYVQFGMEEMEQAMAQLRSEPLSPRERNQLDTVRYWARIVDEEGIETLVQTRVEQWEAESGRPNRWRKG